MDQLIIRSRFYLHRLEHTLLCGQYGSRRYSEHCRTLNAEVIVEEDSEIGTRGIRGMFWRFLVADDPTVDR